MFINNFDPVALQIFSFEIRWYSLAYIIGIFSGWIVGKRFFITNSALKQTFDDFITYSILAIILGGRLGYILLYNPKYYFYNFLDIFKIWEGGMSFHGGLIGVILAAVPVRKTSSAINNSVLSIPVSITFIPIDLANSMTLIRVIPSRIS